MAAPILFTNVRIFDGTGTKPYAGEVRVEGNRISQVAPAPTRLDRNGVTLVDGGGAVLMPGMVEAHAHLSWPCAYDRIILDKTIRPEEHLLITAQRADHARSRLYQRLFRRLARHAFRDRDPRRDRRRLAARAAAQSLVDRARAGPGLRHPANP